MEWTIVFGLVIFAVIALLLSFMTAMRVTTRTARKNAQRQADQDQIGEYFVRAVGTSSTFPESVTASTDMNKYAWMDSEAKEFLVYCNDTYGYTYATQYATEKGNFGNFYRDDAFYRKLSVSQNGSPVLDIVVAEQVTYDESGFLLTKSSNPVTTFDIVEWTNHDTVGALQNDESGLFQKLWHWIGGIFRVTEEVNAGYAVKFDAAGGVCSSTFSYYIPGTSDPIVLERPVRSGFDFLGWSDGENTYAVTDEGNSRYTPTRSVTLMAQWKEQPKPVYTVTFHANGGSVSPASATGSAVSLPVPTRNGYDFAGWYTAVTNGTRIDGTSYAPTGTVTLYARWNGKTYSVTDEETGNTVGRFTVRDYEQTVDCSPATRKGYGFSGWDMITQNTDGKPSSVSDKSIVIPADAYGNIRVKARWEASSYSITFVGEGSLPEHMSYVYSTASQQKTLPTPSRSGYDFTGWILSAETNSTPAPTLAGNTLTVPAGAIGEIKIKAGWESTGGCFASGTLITMADGTYKRIEDIKPDDTVLAYDHETGKAVPAAIAFIEADGDREYSVINLEWSNGAKSRIIYEHGFFDLDLMRYVYIREDDLERYIGHRFYSGKYENGEYTAGAVVLEKAYVTREYTGCYSFPTVYHLNLYTDDMLSMPGGITGMFNMFDFDDCLRYDAEKKQADIERYGLFDYQTVAAFIPYETFCQYPAQYLNVSLGKGLLTQTDLLYLIERYGRLDVE